MNIARAREMIGRVRARGDAIGEISMESQDWAELVADVRSRYPDWWEFGPEPSTCVHIDGVYFRQIIV